MAPPNAPRRPEALDADTQRALLERLYGPKHEKSGANTQIGVAIALLVLGPGLLLWGLADRGEVTLIAVGIVAVAVGVWALFDGLARSRRAKAREREAARSR